MHDVHMSHLLLQGQPQAPVSVEPQYCRQWQAAHNTCKQQQQQQCSRSSQTDNHPEGSRLHNRSSVSLRSLSRHSTTVHSPGATFSLPYHSLTVRHSPHSTTRKAAACPKASQQRPVQQHQDSTKSHMFSTNSCLCIPPTPPHPTPLCHSQTRPWTAAQQASQQSRVQQNKPSKTLSSQKHRAAQPPTCNEVPEGHLQQ